MNPPRYHQVDLDHGLRLALATVPWSEAAAFGIWIPAGSRDDPPDHHGLAHFVEHMTFKGTPRRDARQLSIEIEGQGGQINAHTAEDHTCYEARAEKDLLPLLIDVVCDLVWNPLFPADELDLEREVIREEIALYHDSPTDHLNDLLAHALWSPHPLGNPIVGTSRSIDRITRSELRQHTTNHHSRADVVIAAAGPFEPQQVLDLLAGHLPSTPPSDAPSPRPFTPAPATAESAVSEQRGKGQCHLALGFHTPGGTDPRRHQLRLLSLILGENCSSRLFQELRERRGLCYHVASDLALFDDTGSLEITAGLDPGQRQLALDCIQQQLDDLAKRGPSAEELDRAKRYAIGQSRISFESTGTHLAWAAETLLHHHRIIEPAEARQAIRQVTAEQVATAAADTFRTDNRARAEII